MGDIAKGVVVSVGRMTSHGLVGSSWKNAWILGGGSCCPITVKAAPDPHSSLGADMPVAVPFALYVGVRYATVTGGRG